MGISWCRAVTTQPIHIPTKMKVSHLLSTQATAAMYRASSQDL